MILCREWSSLAVGAEKLWNRKASHPHYFLSVGRHVLVESCGEPLGLLRLLIELPLALGNRPTSSVAVHH